MRQYFLLENVNMGNIIMGGAVSVWIAQANYEGREGVGGRGKGG